MARRLRYQVAPSLDGFIAGPNGEYDWIVSDSAIDFKALYNEFDTVVMGRKTHDLSTSMGGTGAMPGMDVHVFSRTRPAVTHPGVRIHNDDPARIVADLKKQPGKDIWLFGGGELFRYLLDAGLVDTVELAVMPVMLGQGLPLLPAGKSTKLKLVDQRILPKSGIVVLSYTVAGSRSPAPPIRFVNVKPRPKKTAAGKKKTVVGKKKVPAKKRSGPP